LFLVAGLASLAGPTQAQEIRQPLGKWVVDYADTMCSASRTYGPPDKPLMLAFRLSPTGKVVRVIIVRPGRGPKAYQFEARTNVAAGKGKISALRFGSSDDSKDITWINLPGGALQTLASDAAFDFSRGAEAERFPLPGMAAVVKALDACNADLRRHWNVSDEPATPGDKATGDHPRPASSVRSLASYVSDQDYPTQPLSENQGGTTAFMLMVGETGVLEDCMVEETSGIAAIDAVSCGILLQRAKFKPATDASGKPIRSVLSSRITWRIQ
jgi:hypothetical protein